jgi:hypothetical protein
MKCHSSNNKDLPKHVQICNLIKQMGIIFNNHFTEEETQDTEIQ